MSVLDERNRDIIVIGASAGGVTALTRICSDLPADLPATVFAVMHIRAGTSSILPEILTRRGHLRATHAVHGEAFERGRVYLAPPDNHLMLRPGYLHVVRGPKENGHRPAVDPLFRSAASVYGSRVIGVVLTGYRDCGTAGLLSIKARGGVAVVQDPSSAEAADMPQSAIDHVAVDHVVSLDEVAPLLARLAMEPAGARPAHLPTAIAELEGDVTGVGAEIVCPLCQGRMTMAELNGFEQMRCHVGHTFSFDTMAAEQADATERALWSAVRALEESAAMSRRLAERASGDLKNRFAEKEEALAQQADIIRSLLLRRDGLNETDTLIGAGDAVEGVEDEPQVG